MSTLEQLKRGFGHAWHNLAEGWQQFSEHASQALTRFNPIHHSNKSTDISNQISRNTSRWGLLAAEIQEDKKQLYIKIEAPGMQAEDFDIQVIDDSLVVRGEKTMQQESNEGRYHLLECAYGSFERAIPLPAHVDQNQASAKYKKGILTITLAKTSPSSGRRINVGH